jgi:signal peptide peptidase SppA
MKQLPHISGLLYGTPWAILPETHAELGLLYRNYLTGNLPVPQNLDGQGRVSSGVSYQAMKSEGIAIIYLEGIISKRTPDMLCGPQIVDLSKLDALLDDVSADTLIDTLILDLNSPGGVVIGLQETSERLRELSNQGIRLIAYTDYQMASAAYYLAAACDEIYCAPSSVIGSIGTYCAGIDDSRAWEMEGLELILAKSGDLKAMGHPGKAWTPEEKAHLQERSDKCGAEFRDWVTSRRPGVEEAAMQGQWFFAKDAPARLHDGFYRDLPALLADIMQAA